MDLNIKECDFHGWVTFNDLKCDDGRTIRKDSFIADDGNVVPLVWNHQYDSPDNILGKILLKNKPKGVYGYGFLNSSRKAQDAKIGLQHGDITSMSIGANRIRHSGDDVVYGKIREVSLVTAGANPGAKIEYVLQHGDVVDYSEAVIWSGSDLELGDLPEEDIEHSADPEPEGEKSIEHASESDGERTVGDVLKTFNEEQLDVLYSVILDMAENGVPKDEDKSEKKEEDKKGDDGEMTHTVFDKKAKNKNTDDFLQHSAIVFTDSEHGDARSAMNAIINDAKRFGSMRESYIQHATEYGIENIDWLFPQEKTLNNPPDFIKRDTGWVSDLMGGVHKTPFSRIRSIFADITEDDARAKGYIKGNLKKEEFFGLIKRTTTPTTVYKKQKIDHDDAKDITDFDVIAWLKGEMRIMLDEEIARAVLIGDGRPSSSDDKINEQNIRPIWTDEDLYTVKVPVDMTGKTTEDAKARQTIRTIIKARKNYKGSGNPVLYTTEDVLTDMLLIEDNNGRIIYDSVTKLASVLRVTKIVTVPVMEGVTRAGRTDVDSEKGKTFELLGIIVNPKDYNIGADKGGKIEMFDDFDIDYNQQKYLIETRCSGALTVPYSAMAIETEVTAAAG